MNAKAFGSSLWDETMGWKDLVTTAYAERKPSTMTSFPRFGSAVTAQRLVEAAAALGTTFPDELRALLAECDGITEVMEIGGEQVETGWLIWSVDELVELNSDPGRAELGPPKQWLVFANAGADGIVFGYDRSLSDNKVRAWYPSEDRGEELALSLSSFLREWITGRVTV